MPSQLPMGGGHSRRRAMSIDRLNATRSQRTSCIAPVRRVERGFSPHVVWKGGRIAYPAIGSGLALQPPVGTFVRVFFKSLSLLIRISAIALIVAIPLLGVWGLSSLAALHGGERWLAIAAGVLAFPVLPLAWDAWARRRRKKKLEAKGEDEGEPILTAWDRLVVRTFLLNALFVGAIVLSGPQMLFTALSTRGDWMLDGHEGSGVETTREFIFDSTDSLQWLYDTWQEPNEFEGLVDDDHRPDVDSPEPTRERTPTERTGDDDTSGRIADESTGRTSDESTNGDSSPRAPQPSWPVDPTAHPSSEVPPNAMTNLQTAAAWIRGRVEDPRERAKALHDFVAQHVDYDGVALRTRNFPPQDADTVFRTGTGVCAGYANLYSAMAQAAGMEAVVVVGHTRDLDGNLGSSVGHAWNAIRIDGDWFLVDTTWDAGYLEGDDFVPRLQSIYFLTPPSAFVGDHQPEDPAWQLLEEPLSRAEFLRQPMLGPKFASQGLEIVGVDRLQMESQGDPSFGILNPRGRAVIASFQSPSGAEGHCEVRGTSDLRVQCDVPRDGTYSVSIFAADPGETSYPFAGRVHYVVRGS